MPRHLLGVPVAIWRVATAPRHGHCAAGDPSHWRLQRRPGEEPPADLRTLCDRSPFAEVLRGSVIRCRILSAKISVAKISVLRMRPTCRLSYAETGHLGRSPEDLRSSGDLAGDHGDHRGGRQVFRCLFQRQELGKNRKDLSRAVLAGH